MTQIALETARRSRLSDHIDISLLERLASRVTFVNDREPMTVTMPFTGEPLGSVPACTAEDVRAAAGLARLAQRAWAERPVRERVKALLRFHDMVLDRQQAIMDLVQMENGKARRNAIEEVVDVAMATRYYCNTVADLLKPKRRQGAFPVVTETWEQRQPKGVVGFIAPWNYPLTLGITDAIPALLAGNAVLIKPDSQTPFSTLLAVTLLEEAGVPGEVMQVVTGPGRILGTPLIESVDYLMFTGSTDTGRVVAAQAAARLIDHSMELGGKNAMIVLDDADLDRTVRGAVIACFANSGQSCVSIERMYVQSGIYDEFVDRFTEATRRPPATSSSLGATKKRAPMFAGSSCTQTTSLASGCRASSAASSASGNGYICSSAMIATAFALTCLRTRRKSCAIFPVQISTRLAPEISFSGSTF